MLSNWYGSANRSSKEYKELSKYKDLEIEIEKKGNNQNYHCANTTIAKRKKQKQKQNKTKQNTLPPRDPWQCSKKGRRYIQ